MYSVMGTTTSQVPCSVPDQVDGGFQLFLDSWLFISEAIHFVGA